MPNTQLKRCSWVSVDNALLLEYHDREWGVPNHNDRKHFEFLILEAAQAGLNWSIVLNKREGYRRAFSQFDPEKVARYSKAEIDKLVADPGIIRNRMKIESAVKNARALLDVQEEFGSFDKYCWQFVDGRPRQNRWKSTRQIPATIYYYLVRRFYRLDLWLQTASAIVLVASVVAAQSGLDVAKCLVILILAPAIIVVGYEGRGYRYEAQALA